MYEEVLLNADCRAITTSLLAFALFVLFLLGRHVNRFIVEAAYRLILEELCHIMLNLLVGNL